MSIKGIIRMIFTKNDESKSFIVLSPLDLVGKAKSKKSTKLTGEQKINKIFSKKFFNFSEYRNDIDYSDQLEGTQKWEKRIFWK